MDVASTAAAGLDALKREILGTPQCAACGACAGFCPYILSLRDHVAGLEGCRKEEGRCYRFCPRSGSGSGDVLLAGDAGYRGAVGSVLESRRGRGSASGSGAQHGGVVSALLVQALRDARIDAAILTVSDGSLPRTVVAETEDEVWAASGSKFAVAPTLRLVNEVAKLPGRRLGVVALPCQATALCKMKVLGKAEQPEVVFVIGLFCTWALAQEDWLELLARHLGAGARIRRADIPPPPAEIMEIETEDGGRVEIPLADVREGIRDGCRVCTDMTSENADVSVGLVEGLERWNTVLVRTTEGADLVERAVTSGLLETQPLEAERLAHLSSASLGKKRRALAEAERRRERGDNSPYLERIAGWKEQVDRDCR